MNNAYDGEKDDGLDGFDLEEILAGDDEPAEEAGKERAAFTRPSESVTSPASKEGTTSNWSSRSLTSSFAKKSVASNRTDQNPSSPINDGQKRTVESTDSSTVESTDSSTKEKLVVAFQGESGAYSEQALRNHFGHDATSLPCPDFASIFDAIHHGRSQRGILPVENSLAGTVSDAYDQLADHDLRIQGEVILRVEHCLIAPAGLNLRDIKRVRSHPQALAQCQQTLRRQGIEAVAHYDTAGAARDLAARPEPGTAAIASALAAKTYGLEILARHFEDEQLNYTRFFILGLDDPPRKDPSKTSVIFTTRHKPGALHRVLAALADRDINLTKIESRPRRNRPWHYLFYVDFEGHEDQPEIREALMGILKQASFLKVLGSYPAAPLTASDSSYETRP
ncbi:MAG: prephenate dehydratase [Chloroflexota bacterium]|nr:MAG: prephenate dehydratase [Chloroflexota bacterium]